MDRVARRGPLARAPGALKSHNAEKLKGWTLWDFSTSILSQNIKKMQGDPLGKFFFEKKVSQCRKKMEAGPFGLARYGMLRGKQEKPFWFSSLGQIVQFGAIIFCRTAKNYFGQFVWIENQPGPAQVGAISKAQK